MKLAHALLAALKDYGAGEIFGIPGDFALPLFREIEASRILPLYTLSHEPAVGFAADAAARYRGTLGVAAVTYGAGALNMVNAVATAYAEKSAVAVISGAPGAAASRRVRSASTNRQMVLPGDWCSSPRVSVRTSRAGACIMSPRMNRVSSPVSSGEPGCCARVVTPRRWPSRLTSPAATGECL